MQVEAIKKNQHYEVPELDELDINCERITLYFDYDAYVEEGTCLHEKKPDISSGSLQSIFNAILGESAKKRCNVSIGEDRKLLMDAMWDKYGQ